MISSNGLTWETEVGRRKEDGFTDHVDRRRMQNTSLGTKLNCLPDPPLGPQDAPLSSSHFRTSFFEIIPMGRSCSSSVRGRYNRMMYPDTLQMSSHSASKRVHQQCGRFEGSAISQWRVVSSIAALIIVGTAYNAYTGVCNLGDVQSRSSEKRVQRRTRR